MIGLTPIIILLVLGLVFFLVTRQTHKRPDKHGYVKKVQLMVASYSAILLVSIGVFYLLPKDETSQAEKGVPSETFGTLYQAADSGELENVDKTYLEKTWEIAADRHKINVEVSPSENLPIFVEQVEGKDNSIKAFFYRTPLMIERYDINDRADPLGISLASGTLYINPPAPTEVKLSLFKQEFPITQFTGESFMDEVSGHPEQILYIKIPKGMQLMFDSGIQIEYVN